MLRTRSTGLIVIAALVGTLLTPGPARAGDNPCWRAHRAENGFTARINSARTAQGLGRLRLDPELSKAARVHTRAMARKTSLFHTPERRLRYRVTNWVILGENVGVGSTVETLHEAFMNSVAHRSNVLYSGYRHVGIGTIERGGRLWVTVIFEGVTDPDTPLKMPTC